MTHALEHLPLWAAVLISVFMVLGAGITLIGSIGLLRFGSFYERVHAPTLGTTLGTISILIASMICFSVLQSRLVIHELLIILFVSITTPVTLMLLVRAALYRDHRSQDWGQTQFNKLREAMQTEEEQEASSSQDSASL